VIFARAAFAGLLAALAAGLPTAPEAAAEGNLTRRAERPAELKIDAEGAINVYFIPIHPGTYEFFVESYRESGMLGRFEIE
jgi:hypothetical protein